MADPAQPVLDVIADQVLVQQMGACGSSLAEMAAGRFTFFGHTVDFGDLERIDWRYAEGGDDDLLWRLNLGYMGTPYLLASGGSTDLARVLSLVKSLE